MKFILEIAVFCIVLFFYLHIYYHQKVENDLEVYSIEEPSKDKLEETCNLRQPLYFNFINDNIINNCELRSLEENYGAFDVNIRDTKNLDDTTELGLPFVLKEAINVLRNDKESKYISENNIDFLEETAVIKHFKYNDSFLRPPLVSNCKYDFMTGSSGSTTPLRYDLNYRNYYYVTGGEVIVRLIPPKNTKYLYTEKDYNNFEFRSPVNVWDVQPKYRADYDKIKSLDITLKKGMILFIPAYWWYSIKFEKISSICTMKYRTYMNTVSILPEIVMNLLQRQSIKRNTIKNVIKTNNMNEVKNEAEPGETKQETKQEENNTDR